MVNIVYAVNRDYRGRREGYRVYVFLRPHRQEPENNNVSISIRDIYI